MKSKKTATTVAQKHHQEDFIKKGLDPSTFKPLKTFYFLTKEFKVKIQSETNQVYFERPKLSELLKVVWSDVKFMVAMYIFIVYVKTTKRYPKKYLKPYNPRQDGKS